LELVSRKLFVELVLWPAVFKLQALVVGFNLPFDLARLAVDWGEARGAFQGGHSLILWQWEQPNGSRQENRYRSRVTVKSIDSKRAFIRLARPREVDAADLVATDREELGEGSPTQGRFLDLRTLVFALTNQSHSLASACNLVNVDVGEGACWRCTG
jgi:hypothetical protein